MDNSIVLSPRLRKPILQKYTIAKSGISKVFRKAIMIFGSDGDRRCDNDAVEAKRTGASRQTPGIDGIPSVKVNRSRAQSLAESFIEMLASTAPVKPIEGFRSQYSETSGLLRERNMHDPHPGSDHAWYAARIADKAGLYHPCVSFEHDYWEAVKAWEAQTDPPTQHTGERPLAVVLGILASRKIIGTAIGQASSAKRGKALFFKREERRRRKEAEKMKQLRQEEEQAMLADYVDGWSDVESSPSVSPINDDSSSFSHVDTDFMAENGEPMVKRGSMTILFNKMLGS